MPNDPTRVEIITGSERRRRYSAEQKLRLVEGAKQCFAQAARDDGFWEALRGQAVIEIVPTLGEAGKERRSAVLVYQRGGPVELRGFRQKENFVGRYAIIVSRSVPWKTPVQEQAIEAGYEVETPQGKGGGVFRPTT